MKLGMICRRLAIGTCLAAMLTAAARADTAYKTLTLDREGNPIETQTAYRPAGSIEKIGDESLQKPADMAIREGRLYICDTENSRIVVGDLEGNLLDILGEGLLQKPTGLFLTGDGAVIVADQGAGKVFEFAGDGSLQREYGRPVEPLYSKWRRTPRIIFLWSVRAIPTALSSFPAAPASFWGISAPMPPPFPCGTG